VDAWASRQASLLDGLFFLNTGPQAVRSQNFSARSFSGPTLVLAPERCLWQMATIERDAVFDSPLADWQGWFADWHESFSDGYESLADKYLS
jgi:hypothetical protein